MAIPKKSTVAVASSDNMRVDGGSFDIIDCALRNDFFGVDSALERNPKAINSQHKDSGITALMAASGRGLDGMVLHLLKKPEIDLTIVDNTGRSAFDHAMLFPEIIGYLASSMKPTGRWKEPQLGPV